MNHPHLITSQLPVDWRTALADEIAAPYFKALCTTLTHAYETDTIYPAQTDIFKALELTPLSKVKVVILGQDPYHGPGQAHGLAFSVPAHTPPPPSLRNIYKEISTDLGTATLQSGDLTPWAQQGVLLLNTSLTVPVSNPTGHATLGWSLFTDAIIQTVASTRPHSVYMLWGTHARSKRALLTTTECLILEAPHPSPLSAHRGFFGCRHFSKANTYLAQHGHTPITW